MRFNKIAKVVFITLMINSFFLEANARNNGTKFNWEPLMDAIIQVESEGNSRAISGKSCGAMQITPILVEDCNSILKKRGIKKRYTLNDRFSEKKSKEMFVLIMSHYNPSNNVERAIRLWNGGVNYTKRGTQGYYNKVMRLYND
ncbi:MAG: lytic transglycosylase domain-containing protein [Prevotella sp.]|jgi:hypothetical protein|nr:lytic transglycosylase domain-containing protein [Prevotella sp.]MBR2254163.1 lytic transglycosylase domain-containing protein [Prevotella sp.]